MKIKVLKTELPDEFSALLESEEHMEIEDFLSQLNTILKDEKNYVEVEITDVKYKMDDDTDEEVSSKFGDINDQLVLPGEK